MTGQRISDVTKADGPTGAKGLTRREALVLLGAGALVAEQALLNGPRFGTAPDALGAELASAASWPVFA